MSELTSGINRELVEKLYLLGQLKVNKTINVKDLSIINHTRIASWYRWWHDENRHKSINWIFDLIDQTKDTLVKTNELDRKAILLALEDSKKGIVTLLTTYCDDEKICSKVNTLLTEIHITISKYTKQETSSWIGLVKRSLPEAALD